MVLAGQARSKPRRQKDAAPRRTTRHIPGMIQRAPTRNDIPREIAARITAVLQPWRIVLFGSRARGGAKEDSDYDVYVEVDASDDKALKDVERRIHDLFSGDNWTLDVKARRRGTIDRRRDDPGTIEWDVAREGKLLYADPSAPSDLAPVDRVREPSREPPASAYEWLKAAERDLQTRQDLMNVGRDHSPEVCWYSHQSTEKYMKALLVARRVRPKRTHKLEELLGALRGAGLALPDLDADCKLLTGHAITPRYPAGNDLGEEDARAALEAADHVIAAMREHLPRRLH
jgi:HEPN domain-containing protein/predicted nucleotidyltransferase